VNDAVLPHAHTDGAPIREGLMRAPLDASVSVQRAAILASACTRAQCHNADLQPSPPPADAAGKRTELMPSRARAAGVACTRRRRSPPLPAWAACPTRALYSVMPPYCHARTRRRVAGGGHVGSAAAHAHPAPPAAPPPACGIVTTHAWHHEQRQSRRNACSDETEGRRHSRAVGCVRCVFRCTWSPPCEWRPVRIAARPPHCVRPPLAGLGDLRFAVAPVVVGARVHA
jgi:hypothetical protein